MTLEKEAYDYWSLAKKYRGAFSPAGKAYVASIEVPTFYLKAFNPRIRNQLSQIMNKEGVQNVEDQSPDSRA